MSSESIWKSLKGVVDEVLTTEKDWQEKYDAIADKVMDDTKEITNVVKSPPNKYPENI
jgi:hypothetical protein